MFPLLHMFNVKSLDLEPHGFTGITLNDFKAGLYVNYEIASLLLHMLCLVWSYMGLCGPVAKVVSF
jgi:hypothetical protein